LRTLEQVLPDLFARTLPVRLLLERNADARVEGFIEGLDTVGCEEHDAVVLLEQAQEDAHHCVALDVVVSSFLEEDVCLVQEDDSVPVAGHFQDVAQFVLEFVDGRAQLTHCHALQRLLEELTDGLRSQSLASPRWSVQKENAASTFSSDDVLKAASLVLHQALDQFLPVFGEHQLLLGRVVKLDFGHVFDCDLSPLLAAEREALQAGPAGPVFFSRHALELAVVLALLIVFIVGVDFFEGLFVDHASAPSLLLDSVAPGLVLDVVGICHLVCPCALFHKLGSPGCECLVNVGVSHEQFDCKVVEGLDLVELRDTGAHLCEVEVVPVGLDHLQRHVERGREPATLLLEGL